MPDLFRVLNKETAMKRIHDYELEDMYNDMLDECYPITEICGLQYTTSDIYKSVDPIAYKCGLADFIDSLITDGIISEIDGKYFEGDGDVYTDD